MDSVPAMKLRSVLCIVLLATIPGCGAVSMIGQSTRALEHTAKSMDQTRDVLGRSDKTMKELVGSLEKLHAPMRALGALAGPMHNVGTLAPQMERLGTRLEGVETNLQRLETPLVNLTSLTGSLDRIHEMGKPLQAMANIGRDKTKVWMFGLGVLLAWIVTTFIGVYGGFVLALRRNKPLRKTKNLRA